MGTIIITIVILVVIILGIIGGAGFMGDGQKPRRRWML